MAKQAGPIYFIGSIDDLTFYKQGGQYYIKRTSTCSETTKKKYRTEPGYALLRLRKRQFGLAVKLVEKVYYSHLPKAVRKHGLFGKLTGMVNTLLQKGKTEEEALQLLIAHCAKLAAPVAAESPMENKLVAEVREAPTAQVLESQKHMSTEGHKEAGRTVQKRKRKGNGSPIAQMTAEGSATKTRRMSESHDFGSLRDSVFTCYASEVSLRTGPDSEDPAYTSALSLLHTTERSLPK